MCKESPSILQHRRKECNPESRQTPHRFRHSPVAADGIGRFFPNGPTGPGPRGGHSQRRKMRRTRPGTGVKQRSLVPRSLRDGPRETHPPGRCGGVPNDRNDRARQSCSPAQRVFPHTGTPWLLFAPQKVRSRSGSAATNQDPRYKPSGMTAFISTMVPNKNGSLFEKGNRLTTAETMQSD